jgi:hypothetical protein
MYGISLMIVHLKNKKRRRLRTQYFGQFSSPLSPAQYHLFDGAHQSKGRHIGTSCPSFTVIAFGTGLFRDRVSGRSTHAQVIVRWLSRRLLPRVVTAADPYICCCTAAVRMAQVALPPYRKSRLRQKPNPRLRPFSSCFNCNTTCYMMALCFSSLQRSHSVSSGEWNDYDSLAEMRNE